MAYTDARKRANEKWNAANLERVVVDVPKGTKEIWKAYAIKAGTSLAGLVKILVEEKAEREGLKEEEPSNNDS